MSQKRANMVLLYMSNKYTKGEKNRETLIKRQFQRVSQGEIGSSEARISNCC